MNLLDLVGMLELDAEIRSPTSPIKLVTTGKIIGLKEGNRVIDFGCGCGEALALFGKYFGITGVGIDADQRFCALWTELLRRNCPNKYRLSMGMLQNTPLR